MTEQINSQLIWNRAEHDPLIQPIGRSIAARLFYAPESEVYFVAAVSGIYDIAHLPRFADLGISIENLVSSARRTGEYQPGVAQAQLAIGLTDLDQDTLHRLLRARQETTSRFHPAFASVFAAKYGNLFFDEP